MFNQKIKRIIASLLITGIIISGNGFTTLAASVGTVVNDAEVKSQEEGTKNYYQLMYQEEYYEETTIIRSNNSGDLDSEVQEFEEIELDENNSDDIILDEDDITTFEEEKEIDDGDDATKFSDDENEEEAEEVEEI